MGGKLTEFTAHSLLYINYQISSFSIIHARHIMRATSQNNLKTFAFCEVAPFHDFRMDPNLAGRYARDSKVNATFLDGHAKS